MEVRRGRYNTSYEHPQPMVANQPTEIAVPLRSHDHVFLKGHRLMVQVQSTWFPLIDRNPQKFVPSIYAAKAEDFVAATQRIYTSRERASHIVLPVVTLLRDNRASALRRAEVRSALPSRQVQVVDADAHP